MENAGLTLIRSAEDVFGTKADAGVVIGRFQVPNLTDGHHGVLMRAAEHRTMIVFIGCAPTRPTHRNPLSFLARQRMILDSYPHAVVLPLADSVSDTVWSRNLDAQIRTVVGMMPATLYVGRDSFTEHYHGSYPVKQLDVVHNCSGTETRKALKQRIPMSAEARAGVIHGIMQADQIIEPCVDMAVFYDGKILLGRKADEALLRFPGGLFDPYHDGSWEAAASREIREETGVFVSHADWKYVVSIVVDDWRMAKSPEHFCVTTLFAATLPWAGHPQGSDDLPDAVKFYDPSTLTEADIVPEHRELWQALLDQGYI